MRTKLPTLLFLRKLYLPVALNVSEHATIGIKEPKRDVFTFYQDSGNIDSKLGEKSIGLTETSSPFLEFSHDTLSSLDDDLTMDLLVELMPKGFDADDLYHMLPDEDDLFGQSALIRGRHCLYRTNTHDLHHEAPINAFNYFDGLDTPKLRGQLKRCVQHALKATNVTITTQLLNNLVENIMIGFVPVGNSAHDVMTVQTTVREDVALFEQVCNTMHGTSNRIIPVFLD